MGHILPLCYLTLNHGHSIAVSRFHLLSSCVAEESLILFVEFPVWASANIFAL